MRILYFEQSSCAACDIQDNIFKSAANPLPIERFDLDRDPEHFISFGVRLTPMLILLDGNVEVTRQAGPVELNTINTWLGIND